MFVRIREIELTNLFIGVELSHEAGRKSEYHHRACFKARQHSDEIDFASRNDISPWYILGGKLPCRFLYVGYALTMPQTLFSMSFFRWIPDDSADMVSPWIAIYFGLTAIITGATLWRWKTWKAKDSQGLEEFIAQVIDREDVEKGTTYSGDSELTRVNETNSHNESQIATVAGQKKEWEV